MGDAFSITTASGTIDLNGTRQGATNFTVKNVSGHALRADAKLVAEAPAEAGWFKIEGEAERSFGVDETEVYRVDVKVPSTAPPATPTAEPKTYRFRIDLLGTDNPDEEQAQGQWVDFTVKPPPAQARVIPWRWIIVGAAALAVVLLGIGVTVFVLSHRQTTLSASPPTENFGNVITVFAGTTQPVTVKNTGPVNTTVKAAVSGPNASDFSVESTTCPSSLAPNATCTITVRFKPSSTGARVGSLQITGDHAGSTSVALTGTGVPFIFHPLPVAPTPGSAHP